MKNYLLLINANFLALGLYVLIKGSMLAAIWVIIYALSMWSIYKDEEKGAYLVTILLNFAFVGLGGSHAIGQFLTNPTAISLPMVALFLVGFVILPSINIGYIYKKYKALHQI